MRGADIWRKIMVLWLFITTLSVCILTCVGVCKEINNPQTTNKKYNIVKTAASHNQHKPGCRRKYGTRWGWGMKSNGTYGIGMTYGSIRKCRSDKCKVHSNTNLNQQ